MNDFSYSLQKVLSRKKEIETYNLSSFDRKYATTYRHVEELFEKLFFLDKTIMKESYLSFIHYDSVHVRTRKQKLLSVLIEYSFFSFIYVVLLCGVKRFTYYKKASCKLPNIGYKNICFLKRDNPRMYDELKKLFTENDIVFNTIGDKGVTNIYSQCVGITFSYHLFLCFVDDVKQVVKASNLLKTHQLFYFFKLFRMCVAYDRFYKGLSDFDYLIDSCDNSYFPFQNALAKNNSIKLTLIQSGARTNQLIYGYIRCYMFVSWLNLYNKVVVGDIKSKEFFSVMSSSMKRLDVKKNKEEYFNKYGKYDILIVEQLTYPETGAGSDYSNHKYMLSRVVNFILHYPEYKVGYLCRSSRDKIVKGSARGDIILDNDSFLNDNNIDIIDRNFCELAIKSSKISISINSSTRIESFLVGNIGFSISNKYLPYDWIIQLFTDRYSSISDSQSVFNSKLISLFEETDHEVCELLQYDHSMDSIVNNILNDATPSC